MKTILIFDGNNAAHRTKVLGDFRNSQGIGTAVPYGLLSNTMYALKKFDTSYFIYTWDYGRNYYRISLDKNYKANRRKEKSPEEQKIRDDFFKQMKLAQKLFKFLKIPQLMIEGCEADDLMSILASTLSKKFKVVIVSSDRDLLQCVRDNIYVFNPITKVVFDKEEVYRKYNVSPKQFLFARCMIGDKSDNIQGIKGIGEKTAFTIVRSLRRLYIADLIIFLTEDPIFAKRKTATSILQNLERIALNRALMQLPRTCKELPDMLRDKVSSALGLDFYKSIVRKKIVNHSTFIRLMSKLEFKMLKQDDIDLLNISLKG